MILDIVLFALGALIVVVVLVDLASTTVSLSSVRGPLASRVSELVWNLSQRAAGTRFAFVRRGAGPLLLISILVGWLVALTLGWSLVFSVDGALASSAEPDQQSSDVRWVDSLFFVFGSLIGRAPTCALAARS